MLVFKNKQINLCMVLVSFFLKKNFEVEKWQVYFFGSELWKMSKKIEHFVGNISPTKGERERKRERDIAC